ncbi:hypothetical protein F5Y17DRAFT_460716 [Xylariaceae sp. FL0594]|nr:hypothetical protein F5Y17DRAFT_460716 [Xylariaceae sp. FL0594]
MGFIDKIQAKIEIYRLEKRYTRNRHRRSTFVSNAMYVDGEYVVPDTTGSSTASSGSSSPVAATPTEEIPAHAAHRDLHMPAYPTSKPQPPRRLHRFSSFQGFGSIRHANTER